jgi:hypothetical protein
MKLSDLSLNSNYQTICDLIRAETTLDTNMSVFTTNVLFSKSIMQQTTFEVESQENLLSEINTKLNRTEENLITQENLFNTDNKSVMQANETDTTITINFVTYKDIELMVPFIFIFQVVA